MGRSMTPTRSPRRHELLHALREAQEESRGDHGTAARTFEEGDIHAPAVVETRQESSPTRGPEVSLPDMIGKSAVMLELAKLIRLVCAAVGHRIA